MKAPPKLRRLVLGIAGLLAILAVLFLRSRGWNSNPIACRGGEAFQHFLVIETPVYLQRDRAWEADRIGGTGETLGRVGCTVCCLAMGLAHFGIQSIWSRTRSAAEGNRTCCRATPAACMQSASSRQVNSGGPSTVHPNPWRFPPPSTR